jgi:hypothetical protein
MDVLCQSNEENHGHEILQTRVHIMFSLADGTDLYLLYVSVTHYDHHF